MDYPTNRLISRLVGSAFLLAGVLVTVRAEEPNVYDSSWKPVAVDQSPKGLRDDRLVSRLEHPGLPDRLALEIPPYNPAPVQVTQTPKATPVTGSAPEHVAETQTLAPLIP